MTDGTSPAMDGVLVRCLTWGCRFGSDGNFCSRGQCRNCGVTAPARIRSWHLMRSASGRSKTSKTTAKCHAKGLRSCQSSATDCGLAEKVAGRGKTGEEDDKSKVSKWTKGLPKWMRPESLSTGVSTTPPAPEESSSTPDNGVFRQCADALRAMSNPAHQQLAAALTALADEHRAAKQKEMLLARRVQQLDIKIGKRKSSVDSLEATHRDLSQFIQHLQTLLQNTSKQVQDAKTELGQLQTERSEVVKGSSSSGSKTTSSSCCAVPCPSLMRPSANTWRWLSERLLLSCQILRVLRGRADASRFAGGSGGRRMSEKAAHSQPTKQAQSVASVASLNVAASASSLQTSRHVVAGDTVLSRRCLAWLSFRSIT